MAFFYSEQTLNIFLLVEKGSRISQASFKLAIVAKENLELLIILSLLTEY